MNFMRGLAGKGVAFMRALNSPISRLWHGEMGVRGKFGHDSRSRGARLIVFGGGMGELWHIHERVMIGGEKAVLGRDVFLEVVG